MKPSEAIRLGLARNPILSRDVFCCEIDGGTGCACVLGCILDRDGHGLEAQELWHSMPARKGIDKFDDLVDDPDLKVCSIPCPEEILEEFNRLLPGGAFEAEWKKVLAIESLPLASLGRAMFILNDETNEDTPADFDPRPAIADILEKHGY